MKKIVLLTLLPILLAGCGKTPVTPDEEDTPTYSSWKYLVPVQAPAVAMADFAKYRGFETTTQPSTIPSLMASGQFDVVVAPTNVGVNAIRNGGAKYKILSTVTFGNFFIASTGHDSNNIMGADDYIVSFQKNGIPDKVFHYIYGNALDSAITYVASNLEAQICLQTGVNAADDNKPVDYVLIAEPSYSAAKKTNPDIRIYEDLQSKYKNKSDGLILTQASVFVKDSLKRKAVKEEFAPALKASIQKFINKPSEIKTAMDKVQYSAPIFGITSEVAVEVTINDNRMGLGYEDAAEIKEDMNAFLTLLNAPTITDEDIA